MQSSINIALNGLCVVLLTFSIAAPAQTTHNVTVSDNFFSPSNLTIQVGDTVRWNNAAGGNPHDVTADNGSFASQTATSFVFERTFNSAGNVPYFCSVHGAPGGIGMSGNVNVEGGGGGSPFDLALSEISAPSGNFSPGDPLVLGIEITNLGGESSPAYTVTYYASVNQQFTSSDTELGSSNRPALAAGQDDNFNANVNLPQNIPPGNYFIGGIIEVNDANNANNSNADDEPLTVEGPPPAAELALQSVNAPNGSHAQGSVINIQSTVQNVGNAASGSYSITFYASDNNIISNTDTSLGTQNRGGLAAGASHTNPFAATIPANLAPGDYFIGAIIDIVDGNANNNVNLDQTPISVTESIDFLINATLNDTWFNDATPGQGFFITVFEERGEIFLAWFTYDTERPPANLEAMLGEPGHRWLTAGGPYAGDTAQLVIELTENGVFDSPQPVDQTQGYGTIVLEFADCDNATVTYDIASPDVSGVIPIRRVSDNNIPACEAQQAR